MAGGLFLCAPARWRGVGTSAGKPANGGPGRCGGLGRAGSGQARRRPRLFALGFGLKKRCLSALRKVSFAPGARHSWLRAESGTGLGGAPGRLSPRPTVWSGAVRLGVNRAAGKAGLACTRNKSEINGEYRSICSYRLERGWGQQDVRMMWALEVQSSQHSRQQRGWKLSEPLPRECGEGDGR